MYSSQAFPPWAMPYMMCGSPGEPCPIQTRLRAQEKLLENERYRLTLDHNGDISSIYDKEVGMDLLTAPIRMGVHHYLGSTHWPAWELDFVEVMTKPIAYARAPKFTILENGPARVAIETLRVCGPSTFRQVISPVCRRRYGGGL